MTQPYDTFQELVQAIRKVKGDKTGVAIGLLQEEYDMYVSYTFPVTDEVKEPVIPETIEFEGCTLHVTPTE